MPRKFFRPYLFLFLGFTALIMSSCREREDTVSCFPASPVNVVMNLSLPSYFALQNVGGWVYVSEQQSGTRGLIVVRTTQGFKAYNRNAPHLCPSSDTTLEVQNDIKIICPQDGAEWILLTGEPVKTAAIAPKSYPTSYDAFSNTLQIYY